MQLTAPRLVFPLTVATTFYSSQSTLSVAIADLVSQTNCGSKINPQRSKSNLPKLILALAISLAVAGRSVVASEETDVMVPAQQFVEGFNKGDAKMAEAACAEGASIIDDFPPHLWHRAGAASKWFKAYEAYAKANSMSDAVVTLDKPKHVDVTGADAYGVVPTAFRFKKKAEVVNETGVMTLVLHKAAKGWRVTAWSWADN
jgi:hypothetical protein